MRFAVMEVGEPGRDRLLPYPFYNRDRAQQLADALGAQLSERIGGFTPTPTFHVVGIVAPEGEGS